MNAMQSPELDQDLAMRTMGLGIRVPKGRGEALLGRISLGCPGR